MPNLTEYHPKTFFAHVKASNLAPVCSSEYGVSRHRHTNHTCRQKPLEPHAEWVLASGYPIRQVGHQKCLELFFRVTTNKRSDQASGGGTRDDTRKEVRIQKRLNYPEMICGSRELGAGTMKCAIIVQYPNEAPPERQRAVAPRLVLMLR